MYIGDLGTRDPWWEQLQGTTDLDRWLRTHVSPRLLPASERELAQARRLRTILSKLAMALPRDEPIAAQDFRNLVQEASRPDVPPELPRHPTRDAPARYALSTIARDAVTLLCDHPERLKVCGADDCTLVFLDATRASTREWCSMARCGNRAKARRFTRNQQNKQEELT